MSCLVSGWVGRFVNLYATQGLLAELVATFHISTLQASGNIIATNLAIAITAPFVGRLTARASVTVAAIWQALPAVMAACSGSFTELLLWRAGSIRHCHDRRSRARECA
ncbi:MAG: hypothetical protein MUW57_24250 [Pseudomonas sp.]|nr:hypothetical protein [Pseudomonas sp.]